MAKIHALFIDPDNDFMGNDDGTPHQEAAHKATLAVKGATADMDRLAGFVGRYGTRLDQIHVTLDAETVMDIGHAGPWRSDAGLPPERFTQIPAESMREGQWRARDAALNEHFLRHCEAVEKIGRVHTIWPEHSLIGSWGHAVYEPLRQALHVWSWRKGRNVDSILKSMNPTTEQYGAFIAVLPDPNDPTTQLNTRLLGSLNEADLIVGGGEAGSHCVADTFRQLVQYGARGIAKKIVLFTDCMSPVPGYEKDAQAFLEEMRSLGAMLTTSTGWQP